MQDKALELQGREGHREMANPEESQDMEQQVWKTRGPVDAQATHKGASLELPVIAEVALEESDLEALARHIRHILEREYTSEPEEEEPRDILELEYTPEPELRDILELEYTSEQEEVELRDNGQRLGLEYTLEPELRDSGSPRSHGLGALLP